MDHPLAQRRPFSFPGALGILDPKKILDRDTAQMRAGDAEAVDPAPESSLDGGVADVVIHTHRLRVQILEHDVQVPNGSSHQADAGVRMVHGARLILRVERRKFGHARLEISSCWARGRLASYLNPPQ